MPEIERRWPNTEVHFFMDRHSGWRARVSLRIGGRERVFYVPSSVGELSRLAMFLRVEAVLSDIGAQYGLGLPPHGSGIPQFMRVCEERDQAVAQVELLRAECGALERQITAAREKLESLMRGDP